MKKKWKRVLLASMLIIVFAFASIGSPTLSLVFGLSKYVDLETVHFETDILVQHFDTLSEATSASKLLSTKDGQVHLKGRYQKDPSRLEMDLTVALDGPLDRTFTMPVIIEEEAIWFNPPQLFAFIPDNISNQFIMKELDKREPSDVRKEPSEPSVSDLEHPVMVSLGILQNLNVQENIAYVPIRENDQLSDQLIHITLQEKEIDYINERIRAYAESYEEEKPEKTEKEIINDAGQLLLKGFGIEELSLKDLKEFNIKDFNWKNYDLNDFDWKGKLSSEAKQRLLSSIRLEQCHAYFGMKEDHTPTNQQSALVVSYQLGRERKYLRLDVKTTFSRVNRPADFQIETPTNAVRWDKIVELLD